MDVAPGVDKQVKMDYYQNAYPAAQVNDIQEYTQQTLGNIIEQMRTVVIGGIIIALIISVLITSLFLRMLLSKDMSQIAIMRSIGLTSQKDKPAIYGRNFDGARIGNSFRSSGFELFRRISC